MHCVEGYTIIEECRQKCLLKSSLALDVLGSQQISELMHQIDQSEQYLDEYRSHLPRLKSEAEYDAKELETLPDDTAKIISDWKMKILACYFRENQGKFFGKRGTSLLGFMVITNSKDDGERIKGMKDVKFVFMVSDDTLQDEWEVMCGKAYIYSNHLPKEIKNVWFQADGAGCFSSQLNRIVQPFWKWWTGISEQRYRLSPRGGGKTSLDGMFAKAGQVCGSAVDQGCSYYDADSFKKAFEMSGGLTATTLHTFDPDRSNRVWGKLRVSKESVLETILDEQDMSLMAFKHSGYATGFKMSQDGMFVFHQKKEQQKKLPAIERPKGAAETTRDFGSLINQFIFGEQTKKRRKETEETRMDARKRRRTTVFLKHAGCPLFGPVGTTIAAFAPSCIRVDTAEGNRKADIPSKKARPGEGLNDKGQRKRRRLVRLTAKKNKLILEEQQLRAEQRGAGQFLCPYRCPRIGQYCRKRCLTLKGLQAHERKGNHDFPGVSSNDAAVLKASKPGGLLAAGKRPNLQSKVLFVKIKEAQRGTLGITKAVCYGKFNRKELSYDEVYHKPLRLLERLKYWFQYGQDGSCPVLKAVEIFAKLAVERDLQDNGLMFCHAKRGTYPRKQFCNLCKNNPCDCNGMLPPVKMVQQFITSETQKKKKKKDDQVTASASAEAK
jgi:hypothetical protein